MNDALCNMPDRKTRTARLSSPRFAFSSAQRIQRFHKPEQHDEESEVEGGKLKQIPSDLLWVMLAVLAERDETRERRDQCPDAADVDTADGTLLMHWQESALNSSVFFESRPENSAFTPSIRAMFPAKMKKNTKVSSSG